MEMSLKLESRLRQYEGKHTVITLDHAFSAFSGDIIRRVCFNKDDFGDLFMDHPDFSPDWWLSFCVLWRII